MREVTYQEIMREKFRRQAQIKELELHAAGTAIHHGRLSPGCRVCFTGEQGELGEGSGVFLGRECMSDCPMCYYDTALLDQTEVELDNEVEYYIERALNPPHRIYNMAYVSSGETLLYLDKLRPVAEAYNRYEDEHGIKIYHHLYSNGLLASEAVLDELVYLRVDEIRFHVSASNFHPQVLRNMQTAKQKGITVSVEEPSWPPHRQKLFDHLPIFHEIGVQHFNLIEVQLTEHNKPRLERIYPNGIYYKDYYYHVWDEGLVYDLLEEKIAKNYCFSMLDCNSGVERSRHGNFQNVAFDMKSIEGLLMPFDYDSPRSK